MSPGFEIVLFGAVFGGVMCLMHCMCTFSVQSVSSDNLATHPPGCDATAVDEEKGGSKQDDDEEPPPPPYSQVVVV